MTKEVQLNIVNEEKYCYLCGEVLELDLWGKSYCRTCKAEYNKSYYKENKDYYKDYYKEQVANKRFVYMLLGADDRVLYIGSTKGKYRAIYHLKGLTHLGLQEQDWEQLGVGRLVYADVTEITQNDLERCYIERLYIEQYKPLLNNQKPDTEQIDIEKMEILEDIVYNEYIDTEEIDIMKITSPEGKVTFNFNDLILS